MQSCLTATSVPLSQAVVPLWLFRNMWFLCRYCLAFLTSGALCSGPEFTGSNVDVPAAQSAGHRRVHITHPINNSQLAQQNGDGGAIGNVKHTLFRAARATREESTGLSSTSCGLRSEGSVQCVFVVKSLN